MHAHLPRFRWFPSLLATALAGTAGCAGAPLATTTTQPSPAPAPDAFACVREQLKTVGFSQTSHDVDRLRVTARKIDEEQRRPDTQFRRMVDQLEIEVTPATGEGLSSITATASSFAELATQRGPTEVQEKTSETARAAAKTILQHCSRSADSLAAPQVEPE